MITRRATLERLSIMLGGAISIQITAALVGQVLNKGESLAVLPEQAELLAELTDVIIPTTDTPGAKTAGVAQFIIRVMRDCYPIADQKFFYAGLARVDETSMDRHGKRFLELKQKEKIAVVLAIAEKDTAFINKAVNKAVKTPSFFKRLRELTVTGYFISEIGATLALEYLPIPGRFEGDVPMTPGQRAWAISA